MFISYVLRTFSEKKTHDDNVDVDGRQHFFLLIQMTHLHSLNEAFNEFFGSCFVFFFTYILSKFLCEANFFPEKKKKKKVKFEQLQQHIDRKD